MFEDLFCIIPTLSIICNIFEPTNMEALPRDPRSVAMRAERYLVDTNIADRSLWSPELEFYVLDDVRYRQDPESAFYSLDCSEASWRSDAEERPNLGHKIPRKGGYQVTPPSDTLFNLRNEMTWNVERCGIQVKYHHHETGGPGQCELEIHPETLTRVSDMTMLAKYIIKNTATNHGKTVTFMPKPLYDEAGNGLHVHQQLFSSDQPLFHSTSGDAGLSETAVHYIGGLLQHTPALSALVCPSTNSYRRLTPGFEAPERLSFSFADRTACVRIPAYAKDPMEKRIEYRVPDATSNIYLALAAMLMAGIDGVSKKTDPGAGDIANMTFPGSLDEALEALRSDHDFLMRDNVFNRELIETWIEYKYEFEVKPIRIRPHPYEFLLYLDA
jgi:glutamine synthetase